MSPRSDTELLKLVGGTLCLDVYVVAPIRHDLHGVLFEKARAIGRATLSQVSVGAQLGGEPYSQIVFFETPQELARFKSGDFSFTAQVGAVALKSGASAHAEFQNGVAVFSATKGGLMAEVNVAGQKFSFEPFK